jgi:hypothetical protein
MKRNPLWFNLLSFAVLAVTIISLVTSAPLLRIFSMLGLAMIMASLGSFEWNKNRKLAFTLFGVAVIQILVMIDTINALIW